MANSSIIGNAKNKIIKEFIKDKDIIKAIGSSTLNENKPEQYINKHIFNFNQNPFTLTAVETFITVQVHIPRSFDFNKTFIIPQIEIWVVSHERHMIVDNVPKVIENRNDYLSELIDKKLNGRNDFGIGTLQLVSNIEGSYQADYLYRKMIFETKDLNDSLCNKED